MEDRVMQTERTREEVIDLAGVRFAFIFAVAIPIGIVAGVLAHAPGWGLILGSAVGALIGAGAALATAKLGGAIGRRSSG